MHVFFALHALASLAGFIGAILLICWACKHLPEKKLKQYGLWMVIGGIVVSLLSGGFMMGVHGKKAGKWNKDKGAMMMEAAMMEKHDPMKMTMHDMSGMLSEKSGTEFDLAFIEGMIPHHQGAIDMAKQALSQADHEELKELAEQMIASQQAEIDKMREWQKAWSETK